MSALADAIERATPANAADARLLRKQVASLRKRGRTPDPNSVKRQKVLAKVAKWKEMKQRDRAGDDPIPVPEGHDDYDWFYNRYYFIGPDNRKIRDYLEQNEPEWLA
jgi:hypothetical protein